MALANITNNVLTDSGILVSSLQPALNGTGFVKSTAGVISYDTNTYLTTISGISAGGELSGTYANPTLLNSAVIAKVLTGLNLTGGGTISATDSILGAFGKIQNQISALVGGVMYEGTWNASSNSPTIVSSVGTKGDYYIVSTAGTTNINGITTWSVGDWIIFNGTTWDKVDNTDAVSSVNGFTGAVSLTTANISEVTNLYYTDTRARAAITLTTTGTTGAATYSGGTLNIPNYGAGISYPVTSVFGRTGAVVAANGDYYIGTTQVRASSANQALTGITGITFVAEGSDSASIATTINGSITYFDFNLTDDNNNDEWRWRFTPSGSTVYNAMRLVPNTNTTSNLIVSGTIAASNFSGSSSGTNTGDQTLSSLGAQPQLNGTGFVKASGTTISYDNSTYLTTSSASSTYLPLAGGTLTGGRTITLDTSGGFIAIKGDGGGWSMGTYYRGNSGTNLAGFGAYGGGDSLTWAWIGAGFESPWMTLNGSAVNSQVALQQGGNQVLHAGNYNSYAPTLIGGGASGTWGINISGTSTATNSIATQFGADIESITAGGIYRQEAPSSGFNYTTTLNMNSSDGRQQLTISRGGDGMKFRGTTTGSGTSWNAWRTVLDSSNYPYAANMNQYVRTTDDVSFAIVRGTSYTVTPLIYSGGGNVNFGNNIGLNGNNAQIQFKAAASEDLFISCIPGTRTIEIRNGNAGSPNYSACGLITGYATFTDSINIGNGGEVNGLIRMGSAGRYGMGVSGSYTNVYAHNFGSGVRLGSYDGTTFTPVLTANHTGTVTITGNVSAANLSGTNTGDQINISGNAGTVTINYNNDSNSTYQLLWGSGNSVYGTAQVYVNPSSDVIYARGGYISPGNAWGTSDSAFFPNGITTAGGTNWIYGSTYIGNAPGNGYGVEIRANGSAYFLSSNTGGTWGYAGQFVDRNNAGNNYIPWSFESEYGNHSWGAVARFHIQQSGTDKPSIQFTATGSNERWSIGYVTGSDYNFRITQNHGYRTDNSTNDGWGTERFRINTDGTTLLGIQGSNTNVYGLLRLSSNNNLYLDNNYGQSIVGLYNASRYQGVFAMGDAYKLAIDGTSAGNLYGMAWSHPNAGGVASNLNTHGLLVMENGTFLAAISGSIRARDDMRAPIFYDSQDTSYYLDPAGTSNLNKFTGFTMAYNDMNPMSANSPYVARYNGSAGYRNGTMGSGNTDFNTIFSNWGSGFIDSWSSPANAPGGSSHYIGLQGLHYSELNTNTVYGFQMVCAGEADNRFFWRSSWPSKRGWVEMIHSGTIGSQSVNYASSAGSVAWTNVSSRPTTTSAFTNDSGFITSGSNVVGLYGSGFGNGNFTWNQTPGGMQQYGGSWASFLISNHGDGATYYNQTIIMPFWGAPQYMRKEGGNNVGPWTFWTTENLNPNSISGNFYASGSITAGAGFFESSDSRLKKLIQDDYRAIGIQDIKPKLYIKDGKEEVGYYAQDFQSILPSAVSKGADGFLSLSYTQVLVAKVAILEKRILELENKLN
jgi:hypothetical protein